ncbi:Thrombospondin type-1 domain-containing protein 7A [Liparis tanakae]|uniref:Thrombospondin type-1 domain-containing protein 7A n=1 Tax=Liparis tanakae TaxID=230148 RepID=A0A4Z2EU49_9TELE|nr:Thrombospondin type-1 domain-containing protein 7A [Liparis tanakae]
MDGSLPAAPPLSVGGECHEYKWMSGGRTNASRSVVWCQRSDGLNVTGERRRKLKLSECSGSDEAAICMCEEGFTEVLSPTGQLDQCAPIPVLEIPTAGDKKGDVKTSRAVNPTAPATAQPGRSGRTWFDYDHLYIAQYPGSSHCAAVHRSLKAQEADAQEADAHGTALWTGQSAHGGVYTCPQCRELARSRRDSS